MLVQLLPNIPKIELIIEHGFIGAFVIMYKIKLKICYLSLTRSALNCFLSGEVLLVLLLLQAIISCFTEYISIISFLSEFINYEIIFKCFDNSFNKM